MTPEMKRSAAMAKLGRKGGPARAKALSPARRKAIAITAGRASAAKRWGTRFNEEGKPIAQA